MSAIEARTGRNSSPFSRRPRGCERSTGIESEHCNYAHDCRNIGVMQSTFGGGRDSKIISRRRFVATAIGVPLMLAWGWTNRERAEAAGAAGLTGTAGMGTGVIFNDAG